VIYFYLESRDDMQYRGVKKQKRNFKEDYKYAFQEFLESELEYQKFKRKKRIKLLICIGIILLIYLMFKFF